MFSIIKDLFKDRKEKGREKRATQEKENEALADIPSKTSSLEDALNSAIAVLPTTQLGKKVRAGLAEFPLAEMIIEKLSLSWTDGEIHGSALGPIDGIVVTIQTFPCKVDVARAYFDREYEGYERSLAFRNKSSAEELARMTNRLECIADCLVCSVDENDFNVFITVIPEEPSIQPILPHSFLESKINDPKKEKEISKDSAKPDANSHSILLDVFLSKLSQTDQQSCLAHVSSLSGDYEVLLDFLPGSYDKARAIVQGLPKENNRFWGLQVEDGYFLYGKFKVTDIESFKGSLASLRKHCGKWYIQPEPPFAL